MGAAFLIAGWHGMVIRLIGKIPFNPQAFKPYILFDAKKKLNIYHTQEKKGETKKREHNFHISSG